MRVLREVHHIQLEIDGLLAAVCGMHREPSQPLSDTELLQCRMGKRFGWYDPIALPL